MPALRPGAAGADIDALFLSFQQAVVGRYSLERELGRGGMGVVYLAREVRLDRMVAIKLLPPDLAARQELRDRFMQEARTAARLSHPYIIPIHAVDEIDGFVFIVMAYIDGETLAQRIASRGPLSADEVTRIMREVAWALAYAHAQGVVHRDIKPANILIEHGTGRAMVADFGIARVADAGGDTAVGVVLGTPEFMSPEQASGDTLDGRSDLYALGVVAYLAVTRNLPFTAPTAQAVLAMHLTVTPPPVASVARGIPRPLAQAIDRCLQKDPAARYANGEALVDALAPGMEKRAEVPVPIRVFLDRRRMGMMLIPAAVAIPFMSAIITSLAQHGGRWSPIVAGVGTAAFVLGFPFALITYRLRRLLRLGYGLDDIVAGLRSSFERRREEFQFEFGVAPTAREKLFRVVGATGLTVGVISTVAIIVGGHGIARIGAPIAFMSMYAGILATVFSTRWRRLRLGAGSVWAKFWGGKLAPKLAKISGFKLGTRAMPADRPTELAIAMSAEAIFESFSKEQRASLGDVPKVLHGLEAHARSVRTRITELDQALGEVQRGPSRGSSNERQDALVADLVATRERAEARLEELVTALENLRLDLLRLRAGGGSIDGITLDLAAAREFGAEADRLLASGKEVEDTLRATTDRK
ncbi:MAG: serine/threonine-protein kinase [bacterium]